MEGVARKGEAYLVKSVFGNDFKGESGMARNGHTTQTLNFIPSNWGIKEGGGYICSSFSR